MTSDIAEIYCRMPEIPASQSHRWYHDCCIDVTTLLPTLDRSSFREVTESLYTWRAGSRLDVTPLVDMLCELQFTERKMSLSVSYKQTITPRCYFLFVVD